MHASDRTRARDRVLFLLKTKGPQSAADLARRLDLTSMAVRQHLAALDEEALVGYDDERRGVGRPARIWKLLAPAVKRFPDSHAELSVDLLQSMRRVFGSDGLDRLIAARTRRQVTAYRRRLPPPESRLERRVASLAKIRSEEGYMATWEREKNGAVLLLENHCPICAAASFCQSLCRDELSLFQKVLGRQVKVERIEHALSGARRCAYRVTPRKG